MFLFSQIMVVEARKLRVQAVDEQNWLAKRDVERREEFEREAKMVVGEPGWHSLAIMPLMPAFVVAAILFCYYIFLLISRRRRAQIVD